MLEIREVDYRGILHKVSAEWQRGLIGIIGPNGAGKTTLLKLAAGVEQPDTGEVLLKAKAVSKMTSRERAKELAYLPQQVPDDVVFTVQEFVEMGRYAYRRGFGTLTAACKQAVASALRRMNLNSLAHVPLGHLSGGERQRAAIARCLAQETEVLLLDEPISNLDLFYQMNILNFLSQLAKEGYLILMAIHHLELAAQFCDELFLMHNGGIVQSGRPEEVLRPEFVRPVFHIDIKTFTDPFDRSLRLSCTALP